MNTTFDLASYANNLKRFKPRKKNTWCKVIEKNDDVFSIDKFQAMKKKVYKKQDSILIEQKKTQDIRDRLSSQSPIQRKNKANAQIKDNMDYLLQEITKDNIRFRKGIIKDIPKKKKPMDV